MYLGAQFYSAAYKRIMYPIISLLGLCRKIVLAVISHISLIQDNADRIKQTPLLKSVSVFNRNQIRNDISCELSAASCIHLNCFFPGSV